MSTIAESERRARGQASLHLRVDAATVERLDALCALTGLGRSAQVSQLIQAQVEVQRPEKKKPRART